MIKLSNAFLAETLYLSKWISNSYSILNHVNLNRMNYCMIEKMWTMRTQLIIDNW